MSVLIGALLLPASALADDIPGGGFDAGQLNANIQHSVQAAVVSQQGTARSGDATGGNAHADAGSNASGGDANSGAQGGDQTNSSTGSASTGGSIEGGNT
jgi:hypothetical protein